MAEKTGLGPLFSRVCFPGGAKVQFLTLFSHVRMEADIGSIPGKKDCKGSLFVLFDPEHRNFEGRKPQRFWRVLKDPESILPFSCCTFSLIRSESRQSRF